MHTYLIDTGLLLDRRALGAALPGAWAQVLADRQGGSFVEWLTATERVAADWDSYWEDLDLSADDSLRQWREGRWRVVRAWFRLAGKAIPGSNGIGLYLDELPREVGRRIEHGWRAEALDVLRKLLGQSARVCLIDPLNPASLLRGVLEAADPHIGGPVLGPDELGQAGFEGLAWSWVVGLAGEAPERTRFVSRRVVPRWPLPPENDPLLSGLMDGA